MKRCYFLFLLIVCGIMLASPVVLSAKVTDTQREIELRTECDTDNELRSLLPVRAWVDNRVVYVSFLDLPAEAIVSISDTEGNFVNVSHYQSPGMISIPIVESTGTFKIEIECDSSIFIGEFKI